MDLSRKYNAKLVMLHVLNILIPRGSVSLISDKLHEEDRRKVSILLEGAAGVVFRTLMVPGFAGK